LKRNNRDCFTSITSGRRKSKPAAFLLPATALVALLWLPGCSGGSVVDTIDPMILSASGEGGSATLELLVPWDGVAPLARRLGPGGSLELVLEYRVVARSTSLLAGRINRRFQRQMTYDPYYDRYRIVDLWSGEGHATSDALEFIQLAGIPARIPMPAKEIGGWGRNMSSFGSIFSVVGCRGIRLSTAGLSCSAMMISWQAGKPN
jgi:hypothetical protein